MPASRPPPGGWRRTRRGAAGAAPPGRAAEAEGRPRDGSPGAIAPTLARTPARRLPGPGRRGAACSSPHLQAGPRCRPGDKSVPLSRRGEGRRSRSPAHHPRPPAGLSARPGVRSGLSLASRRTTEQPSCAPTQLLLSPLPPSLAPSLPRSRLSPHHSPRPAPPLAPCPRPRVGGDTQPANRGKGLAPPHRPASSTAHPGNQWLGNQ